MKAQVKLWRAVRAGLALVERGEIWQDEVGKLWKRRQNGAWYNIADAAVRWQGYVDEIPGGKLGMTADQVSVWLDLGLSALLHTGEIRVDEDSGTIGSDGALRFRVLKVEAK